MKKTSIKAALACAVIGVASLACKENQTAAAPATDPAQAKELEAQKEISEAREKANQRVWAATKKEPLYIDAIYNDQHVQRYGVKEDKILDSASGKSVQLRYVFAEKTQKLFICLKSAPDADTPKPAYVCLTPQEFQAEQKRSQQLKK